MTRSRTASQTIRARVPGPTFCPVEVVAACWSASTCTTTRGTPTRMPSGVVGDCSCWAASSAIADEGVGAPLTPGAQVGVAVLAQGVPVLFGEVVQGRDERRPADRVELAVDQHHPGGVGDGAEVAAFVGVLVEPVRRIRHERVQQVGRQAVGGLGVPLQRVLGQEPVDRRRGARGSRSGGCGPGRPWPRSTCSPLISPAAHAAPSSRRSPDTGQVTAALARSAVARPALDAAPVGQDRPGDRTATPAGVRRLTRDALADQPRLGRPEPRLLLHHRSQRVPQLTVGRRPQRHGREVVHAGGDGRDRARHPTRTCAVRGPHRHDSTVDGPTDSPCPATMTCGNRTWVRSGSTPETRPSRTDGQVPPD